MSYVTDRDEPPLAGAPAAAFPRTIVISVTAAGALLLLLNGVCIGCYRRRRHLAKHKAGECPRVSCPPRVSVSVSVTARNAAGSDAGGAAPQPAVLGETAQLPWIVIIAVSSVGALLLVVNVALVVFFIRRRMRNSRQPKVLESACEFSVTFSYVLFVFSPHGRLVISSLFSTWRVYLFLTSLPLFALGSTPRKMELVYIPALRNVCDV